MRIGPATGAGQNLRLTAATGSSDLSQKIDATQLGFLTIEMTWPEWDELCKDAEHLRTTGQFRDTGLPCIKLG